MKASDIFVDEAEIRVQSGDGGDGAVGYRREKFVPRGGPDGGDGGHGGDAVLVADEGENTLLTFRARREFRAGRGARGGPGGRTGARGETVVIQVPVGTMVFAAQDPEGAAPIADLAAHGDRYVAARGGRGGWGNKRFKTATRQTPDFAKPGLPGDTCELRLSLKLLADVGLVGFPNAGKSTWIRAISAARPRVASYPFTTLVPSLGVVEHGERRFVVADIPGLIPGASEGAGLGDRFLRHIERTRVLVHLLDLGAMIAEERDLLADYETLRAELGRYEPSLLEREEIVLLNKSDLVEGDERPERVASDLERRGCRVLRGSGATGAGRQQLVAAMLAALDECSARERAAATSLGESGEVTGDTA